MKSDKIRVLIADDSDIFVSTMTYILEQDANIEIVGVAKNGKEAISLVDERNPDIVTIDVHMPVMNGLDAVEQIMARNPKPILVLTEDDSDNLAFAALERGALDFAQKPAILEDRQNDHQKIVENLKLLATVRVVRHIKGIRKQHFVSKVADLKSKEMFLIAIGGSTGAPQAINAIVQKLPKDINASILIVQHMSAGFCNSFSDWLSQNSPLNVSVAGNNERIDRGQVRVAPDKFHMVVDKNDRIKLRKEPQDSSHRPSVSTLFEAVAEHYRDRSIGVVLSGMGKDGALGAIQIANNGGKILAQNESSSLVFGMPKATIETHMVDHVLHIDEIGPKLTSMVGLRK